MRGGAGEPVVEPKSWRADASAALGDAFDEGYDPASPSMGSPLALLFTAVLFKQLGRPLWTDQ